MNSTKNQIIEFAPFKLAEGVDEPTFIAASDDLQENFLSQQEGFLRRDLVRNGDGTWADIAYWESRESVEQAMQKALDDPAALRYFQLMANNGQGEDGGQLMLMSIAKSYS
ncbi:MAG TPA: antibiotic biosynthesis monooxygenase [Anaerolineales bacterium]|nr:antibiotic biosynthesis monooxygenase [Anaerolineales bacterium]